jgi:predicted NBD/HSP70 family sugar kinase
VPLPPKLAKAPQGEYKALLDALRSQGETTRSELAALCELPRSSVSLRVRELLDAGLLEELGDTEATGGRRAGRVGFAPDVGVVLAIELGSTHARWRLADFAARPLADGGFPIVISAGGDEILGPVEAEVRHALDGMDLAIEAVRSCAVGFPGPVNFADGRVTGPPHMAGWDQSPVATPLSKWVTGPIVVDNDVNVMAWGEYDAKWRQEGIHDLLFIKHGTGIGCGIIANGQIYRGYDGTAGEVGHICVTDAEQDLMCSCGSKNCLEVVASGGALVKRLKAQDYKVGTAGDVSRLVVQGDLLAMSMVRDAGKALGAVMSGIVSFFNPAVIVMGGSLGALEISLLAGMREATYAQATMFSTRHLRIVPSSLGPEAALHGATLLALDLAYDAAIELLDDRGRQALP